ncbi:MAG: hypothetical protein J0653_06360 [Deltaproteobacteria bacterium]|nr:hypothetical protein [Deltaproteobacteria bacterium]
MKKFFKRLCYSFLVRSLEIELNDRQEAMRLPMTVTDYTTAMIRYEDTKRQLANARAERDALLPPGSRRTYTVA